MDLLSAILEDDRRAIARLVAADRPSLRAGKKPKLYTGGNLHCLHRADTPLHLAAAGHRSAIVEMLLAAGADPNPAANHRCASPLHYGADGYLEAANWNPSRQVKDHPCAAAVRRSPQAPDRNGATPLHRAMCTHCADAVECLLDAGADATARNRSGSTVFHLAAQPTGRGGCVSSRAFAAQRRIIEELLRRGVSSRLEDGKGQSVRDFARSAWVRDRVA